MEDYEEYQDKSMREYGFDPKAFTREQISLILQPDEAPENYHCDGEITPEQAEENWIYGLERLGLTTGQILLCVKRIIG